MRNSTRIITAIVAALFVLFLVGTVASAQTLSNADCLGCHQDPTMTKDVSGKAVPISVDPKKLEGSIHGSLSCTDCHADIKDVPHEPAPKAVKCVNCHPEAQAAWQASKHGVAVKSGMAFAAHCIDCHGGDAHAILPSIDINSSTHHTNIPATCGKCHGQKFVMEKAGLSNQMFVSYQQSVHGRAVARGSQKAAVCTDCHDYHAVLPANNPQSSIFKFNVPHTCGQCHANVTSQFTASVHGAAIARGNWTAPVCTDCHGIHAIKVRRDPTSATSTGNMAEQTCAKCHAGVRLTQEFGIPGGRITTYNSSYHGLANKLGSSVAANCASCHGVHYILPSSDRRSSVNKANLQNTCGHCHKGATAKFAMGRIHLVENEVIDRQSFTVTIVRRFYLAMIFATIGGMLLHNILIWFRKAQRKRRAAGRTVVRMNVNQRVQHLLLLSSFIVLVLTGFALAYPESPFAWLFGSSETPRRLIHRIAALVMMGVGLYHIGYMVGTREGRQGLKDFWFNFKDARDVVDVMKYYLGLSKKHPRMGRFTYGEKAEYWAVVWGTVVMGITGLMIWYNVISTNWMPRWWIDVATTIHFYEAVLATLAIIVWHLYNVIFDPDAYPLNWAWFDGKMDEEQFEHEHGLEYDKMRRERLEGHIISSDRE